MTEDELRKEMNAILEGIFAKNFYAQNAQEPAAEGVKLKAGGWETTKPVRRVDWQTKFASTGNSMAGSL